jgi:hypothetical protein
LNKLNEVSENRGGVMRLRKREKINLLVELIVAK